MRKRVVKSATLPDWANRIIALRGHLGINQAELARKLECSAMTVSRWERGLLAPSADFFIRLGNFSNKSDCWFFWERAGLEVRKVSQNLHGEFRAAKIEFPQLEKAHAGAAGIVSLPFLKATASAHAGVTDRHVSLRAIPATRMMGAPSDWCPNPRYTSLLRVKGKSMEPLIHSGDILAVDSLQTERTDLMGKVVIVAHEEKGLCVSRLRRYDNFDILESENREYDAVVLSRSSGWRILGRVLWWISAAP
jgi:transcriptional regulator with XRE-family HTH domain